MSQAEPLPQDDAIPDEPPAKPAMIAGPPEAEAGGPAGSIILRHATTIRALISASRAAV